MALKAIWTDRAIISLSQIQNYLLDEWGSTSVTKFTRRVNEVVLLSAKFPAMGVEIREGIHETVIVEQITLFYRIVDDHLVVLDLFDTRQNPTKRND